MKFISKMAAVFAALASVALMGAPAKAQSNTYDAVNNVVLQGALLNGQVAGAAANATSTGTAITSTATADATSVNLGNTSSLSADINASAYQPNGNMGAQVNGIVGQVSVIGGQTASTTANATALAQTNATALSANIANSATQRAGVTSLTSQH